MTLAPLTIGNFNATLTKSEGRDKAARTAQFMCRFIIGLTMNSKVDTSLKKLNDNARSLMVQLAGARRTHRWCKEFPVVQSIPKTLEISNPIDRIIEVLQKATLATFLIIDHVGWLKQVKILSGGKRAGTGTIQLGLKFFCASNFMAGLSHCKKLYELNSSAKSADEKEISSRRSTCFQNAAKHFMLVIQTLHLSRLYETNDTLIGFLGVITSLQDFLTSWPKGGS